MRSNGESARPVATAFRPREPIVPRLGIETRRRVKCTSTEDVPKPEPTCRLGIKESDVVPEFDGSRVVE